MSKEDAEILEEAKERFAAAHEFYSSEYERGVEDVDFVLGKQWEDRDIAKRLNEGRPCLTENRLLSHVHQVINEIRQSRPAINVIPADDKADVKTAKILKGIIRNIENQSGADNVYDTAAWNAITTGYGWIRVNTKYSNNENFDQEVELIRVPDFQSVYLDPNSKMMDGSDAEWGFVFEDMDEDKFEDKYPDASQVSFDDKTNENWCTEDTVRVAEYFYKEYTKKTLYLLNDGTITEEETEDYAAKRDVQIPVVKWCKLTAKDVLEKTTWESQHIPLVPVYGEEVWQDNRRKSFSLITQAKDPQRRFNYWLTASTEIIALQPKQPYIGVAGQFATNADKWANANNDTFSFLEYDPVQLPDGSWVAQPPQRQSPPMGSPAMFQEMLAAGDGIKSALGMFNPSLGQDAQAKSGKAILAQQAQGNNATFHFVDNLQSSIRQVGRICVELIPKLMSEPQIIRIIGDDDEKQMVPINQAVVETQDGFAPVGQNQIPTDFFDMNVGKYDVVATVGQSYATKRIETANTLQALLQSAPETFGIFGDIFLKNLDVADAEVLSERWKKAFPQMADDQAPEAQALMQAQQAMQAMQAQLAQMDQALQQKREKDQAEIGSEIAKNEAAIQKTQADIKKTEAETVKIMAEIQAAQVAGAGLTPEAVQEILRTIALVEEQSRDTAEAVDLILSNEEQKQASLQPEPNAMLQGGTL